jgi:hypothetical protein
VCGFSTHVEVVLVEEVRKFQETAYNMKESTIKENKAFVLVMIGLEVEG